MISEKTKNIIMWCLSVFCFTGIFVFGLCIGSVLLVLCGILLLPIKPIQSFWKNVVPQKKGLKTTALIALFAVGVILTPQTPKNPITPSELNGEDTTWYETVATTPELTEPPETFPEIPDATDKAPNETASTPEETKNNNTPEETKDNVITHPTAAFDYSSIPQFNGKDAYVALNDNTPYFPTNELSIVSYESYSTRDSLNRCGTATANIGKDLMPTEERGSIGMVKPSGWQTVKYDCVDGKYLYNRCHLIGFQLTGENANEDNLITGTRYMNTQGMLPFENMVADYVKETDNHVLYRVTPVFIGSELVARGVLMEAYSVEDKGDGICFNVFCYNVQPNIEIDYSNGESKLINSPTETQPPSTQPTAPETSPLETQAPETQAPETQAPETQAPETQAPETQAPITPPSTEITYVLNTKSHKFHKPSCKTLPTNNRKDTTLTREEVIAGGYSPCGNCHP